MTHARPPLAADLPHAVLWDMDGRRVGMRDIQVQESA